MLVISSPSMMMLELFSLTRNQQAASLEHLGKGYKHYLLLRRKYYPLSPVTEMITDTTMNGWNSCRN